MEEGLYGLDSERDVWTSRVFPFILIFLISVAVAAFVISFLGG